MTSNKNSRLPNFDQDSATPEQLSVLTEILSGPRGNLNGPFLGWIASPELAQLAQRLGAFCRYRTGLPLRLSELAILITAAKWQCQAEWHIHYPIALEEGVTADLLEKIRLQARPVFVDQDDELIWCFANAIYDNKRVGDPIFDAVQARFGTKILVNLVGLLGYYSLVAMTLNIFDMRGEGQVDCPFPEP